MSQFYLYLIIMSQLPANTSGGLIPPYNTSVARVPFTYEKDGYSRERYQGYSYSNNFGSDAYNNDGDNNSNDDDNDD